jgi:hypothetical protein
LDVRGLASCYYTAGGVGIAAVGTGDGGAKKKGLNLNWIYAFGAAALIAVGCVLWFGVRWSTNALLGSTVARRPGVAVAKVTSGKVAAESDSAKVVRSVSPGQFEGPKESERKYFRGIILDGGKVRVAVDGEWCFVQSKQKDGGFVLSDGRVVFDEPREVLEKRKKAAAVASYAVQTQ